MEDRAAKSAPEKIKPPQKPISTTAAILGFSQPAKPAKSKSDRKAKAAKTIPINPGLPQINIKPEWEKFYKSLVKLHDRLVNQIDGLAKESAEHLQSHSEHIADSGTDNFDRDFTLSLLSSDQDAIYEIEEALKRIEKGTYGICEETGKTIPKARLEAIPWTRYTVDAQTQLERNGILKQRRLGTLGSIDSAGFTTVPELEELKDLDPKLSNFKDKE